MNIERTITAAEEMDWMQVVLNQGPPCFHLEESGRFCGRAERWDGHRPWQRHKPIHKFVGLADLVRQVHTDEAQTEAGAASQHPPSDSQPVNKE